ncbi:MAG: DivIVA domain-containing protein [Sporichthyaceae bacterium]
MFVLMVLLVAVVVFGVAAVAAGQGGTLAEAAHDRAPWLTPGDPLDLEAVRFPQAIRGYRMDLVDRVLDRAAAELAAKDAEVAELRARLRASQ